ncbi:MAG: 1,4-beta-xylanase [Bacteroidetes bacterium GWF2_42_66]|nr:MAG: 1,4-beta-xylanase [Bacteroidetes bacterium GWA2_42_15]OFX98117.1 MAG: 1,4-beta-xylanase [Bacteroidetes bacterium GWE2_42_39]OFY42501.1 MAG: 1,4-beta-xylanase [Bacteroidetes bacterium GWF2_42_66]HAZ03784.1 1,4-beta-xylanase [Marinilabiliales bacterium]HBL74216.1 1,4-beta-xylanase [Prolixibacteraceae bacterium]
MKKVFPFLYSILIPTILFAQNGKVFDNLSMKSAILNSERKYAIYLPPDYETSERSYPVLYLLHGAGQAGHISWVQCGEVLYIADKAIREGKCTPMIIVMPDATAGRQGYFNSVKGDWRYEDFFFEEFIPFIEGKYRIRAEKRYRAIAGLSMGGGGAFIYALHHPELFSSACPLSANASMFSLSAAKEQLERREKETVTDKEAETYYQRYSAIYLVENIPEEQKKAVRWYIDCGDDDFLYEGNSLIHIAMRKGGIPHEFRIRDGGHTWTYWRTALPEVLDFVSQAFHQ